MRTITKIGLWIFALTVFISVNAGCRESQQKSEPQPVKETAVAPAVGETGPSGTIFGPFGVDPEPMPPETLRKVIETEEYGEVTAVKIRLEYPGSPVADIYWRIRCPSCPPEDTLVSYQVSRHLGGTVWTQEDWMKAPEPTYWEMVWKRNEKEALSRVRELLKKISEIPPDRIVLAKDALPGKQWGGSVNYSLSHLNVMVLFVIHGFSKPSLDYPFSCEIQEKKCDEVWQTYKHLFLDEIRKKYPDIPPDQPLAGSTSEPSTP